MEKYANIIEQKLDRAAPIIEDDRDRGREASEEGPSQDKSDSGVDAVDHREFLEQMRQSL